MFDKEGAQAVSDPERELDRLRRALAAVEPDDDAPRASAATRAPLDAGRIFDAVHGRSDGSLSAETRESRRQQTEELVDELSASAEVAEAWRLASELAPPAAVTAFPAVPRNDRASRRTTWAWLATAAVLILGVGFGWRLLRPGEEVPVYRSGEARTIAPALSGDSLSRQDPVLRWTAIGGARYRVRLLTADLQLLDESPELAAAEYRVDAGTLAGIPANGTLAWQVEARLPGEGNLTSPTFLIRVP